MNHLDLFSGIGGFSLAARWAYGDEHKPIAFCEIDKYCQKVLKKHWPDVPIFEDIRSLDGRQFRDVDLLTGGYPCQPFSVAGKQKGHADERFLWPEMLRVIKETRPRWIVGENVKGHIALGLCNVLADLETAGYEARAVSVPACALGANHERERIYILAYATSDGRNEGQKPGGNGKADEWSKEGQNEDRDNEGRSSLRIELDWNCTAARQWGVEPPALRVDDGLPDRMDRNRCLGNAIVPEAVFIILSFIKAIDEQEKARENGAVGCSPAKI